VQVHRHANVVRNNAQALSDFKPAPALFYVDKAVFLVHLMEHRGGRFHDVAEGGFNRAH
jgi:hypothetical protein